MSNYRRIRLGRMLVLRGEPARSAEGSSDRQDQHLTLIDKINILRGAVAATRQSHPFEIDAFVVRRIICTRSGSFRRGRRQFLGALAVDQDTFCQGTPCE
ncbi:MULTISPECIES: hypothetical protein [unclassified Bradyrhizobium]|uniref:hypothetical protein n=1 Tax=unclassified Bradyrhizobium TaxID=2631580 RepID=UPI0031F8915F